MKFASGRPAPREARRRRTRARSRRRRARAAGRPSPRATTRGPSAASRTRRGCASRARRCVREVAQQALLFPATRLVAQPTVIGAEDLIHAPQPAILAPNHESDIDTPLVLLVAAARLALAHRRRRRQRPLLPQARLRDRVRLLDQHVPVRPRRRPAPRPRRGRRAPARRPQRPAVPAGHARRRARGLPRRRRRARADRRRPDHPGPHRGHRAGDAQGPRPQPPRARRRSPSPARCTRAPARPPRSSPRACRTRSNTSADRVLQRPTGAGRGLRRGLAGRGACRVTRCTAHCAPTSSRASRACRSPRPKGVLLLVPFEDDRFLAAWEPVREVFAARQGFGASARVPRRRFVAVVHWSSPLMYARAVREEGDLIAALPFAAHARRSISRSSRRVARGPAASR